MQVDLNKGFTLVELLVVIAIIGILSSVAVVNLNSARDKAKQAAVVNIFDTLRPAIFLCLNDGLELKCIEDGDPTGTNLCNSGTQTYPNVGESICEGSTALWPDLSGYGWTYDSAVPFSSSVDNMAWSISAENTIKQIVCTQNSCAVTDL